MTTSYIMMMQLKQENVSNSHKNNNLINLQI